MALVLKKLSPDDDQEWSDFCTKYLQPHETKWNKKLEDYKTEEEEPKQQPPSKHRGAQPTSNRYVVKNDEEDEEGDDDEEDRENEISAMLQNGAMNLKEKRGVINKRPTREEIVGAQKEPEVVTDPSYDSNQYWKTPGNEDQEDLEAIMKEEGYHL